MHGYLIIDLETGKLLSSLQITTRFGFHHSQSGTTTTVSDPLYISGLLSALCKNANALDPSPAAVGLALTRLETPELALELALDNRTSTLSAVFCSPCVDAKTRRLISRELLELYLQYAQGLDPRKTFGKVVELELFPAIEIYLAENLGLRFPRCPAWMIISSAPHPSPSPMLRTVTGKPRNPGPMTSVLVDEVQTRRRPSIWSCFKTKSPGAASSKLNASEDRCYKILRLNSSQRSSFRDQLNMSAIGNAAEAAAALLVEEEVTQEPYRLADITIPGSGHALAQRLLIAVRARDWVAIPVFEKDAGSKPDEIACLAQTEILCLLEFVRYTTQRRKRRK